MNICDIRRTQTPRCAGCPRSPGGQGLPPAPRGEAWTHPSCLRTAVTPSLSDILTPAPRGPSSAGIPSLVCNVGGNLGTWLLRTPGRGEPVGRCQPEVRTTPGADRGRVSRGGEDLEHADSWVAICVAFSGGAPPAGAQSSGKMCFLSLSPANGGAGRGRASLRGLHGGAVCYSSPIPFPQAQRGSALKSS